MLNQLNNMMTNYSTNSMTDMMNNQMQNMETIFNIRTEYDTAPVDYYQYNPGTGASQYLYTR